MYVHTHVTCEVYMHALWACVCADVCLARSTFHTCVCMCARVHIYMYVTVCARVFSHARSACHTQGEDLRASAALPRTFFTLRPDTSSLPRVCTYSQEGQPRAPVATLRGLATYSCLPCTRSPLHTGSLPSGTRTGDKRLAGAPGVCSR